MPKRLAIPLAAFALTVGATVVALVVMKHGSITELVPHAPPKHARFDDPTLAAVRDGGAGPADGRATAGATRTSSPGGAAHRADARRRDRGHRPPRATDQHAVRGAGRHASRAAAHPLAGSGDLLVVCRPSCRVYIDGHARGHSPPLRAIALPVGNHRLRVIGPSGHERRRAILVAPNRVNRVTEVFGDGKAVRPFRQETGTESW